MVRIAAIVPAVPGSSVGAGSGLQERHEVDRIAVLLLDVAEHRRDLAEQVRFGCYRGSEAVEVEQVLEEEHQFLGEIVERLTELVMAVLDTDRVAG